MNYKGFDLKLDFIGGHWYWYVALGDTRLSENKLNLRSAKIEATKIAKGIEEAK